MWSTSTRTTSVRQRAGATILSEPTDQEYGQREYDVRDPDGHSLVVRYAHRLPPAAR